MRTTLRAYGIEELLVQLNHAGERVKDGARKTMHKEADIIVEEAKLNTPVDKHNLEESIKKVIGYGFRGRLQIEIVMGGSVNGVNVDAYAMEIHENYDMMHPGPGTVAKQRANPGRIVGGKFLERAMQSREPKLKASIISAVVKEWRL